MGDPSLLQLQETSGGVDAEDWGFSEEASYIAFYVACSDATPTTKSVLQRLINSLTSVDASSPSSAHQLVDRTTRKRVTLKVFEAEVTRTYQPPTPPPSHSKLTLEEKLLDAVDCLVEAYGHRVLLIIDELDRVRNTNGLASFIKNASCRDLKFLLVGIGQNITSLLGDHRSLERIAVPVRVPRMAYEELQQIVDRATRKLHDSGVNMEFDEMATDALASAAAGFPWFVHLLGQAALLKADEEGRDVVTELQVVSAVRSLMANRLAQQFSDLYQTAVRDSARRESVLRALALWDEHDIPTTEVYRVVRSLGVAKPSPYITQLCSDAYGCVLLRSETRGIVRFANEMFKVYVRIRPSLYASLDVRVRQAHRRRQHR